MKKLLLIPVLSVLLLASCKENSTDREMALINDKQFAIDSMKMVMDQKLVKIEKQKSIDSMQLVAAKKPAARSSQRVQYVRSHANPIMETPVVAAAPAKKGWSNLAKGAVIGAGVGAVGGAIIDKKKPVKGAIIGGLIGAGVGAGTGAILDAKKKKREQGLVYAY